MNIIQLTEALKDFSDDQLVKEMQQPSGNAPQYLVLSELERRKSARDRYKAQQKPEPTVAEEVVMGGNSAIAEPPQQMNMRSGGLMAFGRDIQREIGQDTVDPFLDEVEQMAQQKFDVDFSDSGQGLNMSRPASVFNKIQPIYGQPLQGVNQMPFPVAGGKGGARIEPQNMFTRALRMNEGGIAKLKQGSRVTDELLEAIMMRESGGDPTARGAAGEVGPYQILPTTAISPGYNIPSLFPELERAVAEGKYASFQEAYEANKDLVDSTLTDVDKSRDFARNYLTESFARYPEDDARAIASYNVGIQGASELENPLDFPYVRGVSDNIPAQSAENLPSVPFVASAEASTGDASGTPILDALGIPESSPLRTGVLPERSPETATQVNTLFEEVKKIQDERENEPPVTITPAPVIRSLPNLSGRRGQERRQDEAMRFLAQESFASDNQAQEDFQREAMAQAASPEAQQKRTERGPQATQKRKDEVGTSEATEKEKEKETEQSLLEKLMARQEQSVETAREDAEFNKYLALAQMGAALASARGPSFLGNVGEAVQAGLPTLAAAKTPVREAEAQRDKLTAELAIAEIKAAQKTELTDFQRASLANSLAGRADRIRDDINKIRGDVSMFGGDQTARDTAIADLENTLIKLEQLQQNVLTGLPLDTMLSGPSARQTGTQDFQQSVDATIKSRKLDE